MTDSSPPAPAGLRIPGRQLPRPTLRVVRWSALAALVSNVVIVATGGLVRLTGSGLGCPTWPVCTSGSLVPTEALGWHGVVEFTNRTLTGELTAVSALLLVTALLARPRRRDVRRGAIAMFAAVPAQAVIGGVLVLSGLNPWLASLHFMFSMAVVVCGAWLVRRTGESDSAPALVTSLPLRRLAQGLLLAGLGVCYLGTLVTGSGPHAGAPDVARIGIAPRVIAQGHADAVMLLIGGSIGLAVALHAGRAPAALRRAAVVLLVVEGAQAIVGYVQYFTHLPIGLVDLHLVGASLLVVALTQLVLATRSRGETAVGVPGVPDQTLARPAEPASARHATA